VVEPSRQLTSGLVTFDRSVVDGAFSGGATVVAGVGVLLRRVQNGFVRSYAVSILAGVLLVVLALLAVNLA
jgi:NADH-quinone oxidoreductase subunit L